VRGTIILAAVACLGQFAMAQQAPTRGHVQRAQPTTRPLRLASPAPSLPQKVPPPMPQPTECDAQLAKMAVLQPLGPLSAPGGCGAADAVLLESVILPGGEKVAIAPPATMRCTMAQTVAQWVRETVAPAAAKLGSPLRGLENLDSYECRSRDRVVGAKLSEHGRANALDVRSFKLANGKTLVLVDPQVSEVFRAAVRAGACARFMTVLGPGSDRDHADVITPVQAEAAPIPPEQVPLPRPRPIVDRGGRR